MPGEVSVFIVACEPSGDALGGALIKALRDFCGERLTVAGVGGDRMAEQGIQTLAPLGDLAVMGFAEVVPRIPLILRRQREIAAEILSRAPDVVVTIDSSSFNKGLAKRLIRAGFASPRVHYVAPMVWAWRPGRVHGMAKRFDHLLTLFPFEPPFFEAAGLRSSCVGHPAIESAAGDREAFRKRHGIGPDTPVLCLLPGSRRAEVTQLLPRFYEAAVRVRSRVPTLQLVLPTVFTVADLVAAAAAQWQIPTVLVGAEADRQDAFAASDAALAASGTVTLELALAGVPMAVAYRPNAISGWIAARLISIPFVSLVNIILGRGLVPELLRGDCRPDLMAEHVLSLLTDPAVLQLQRDGFQELRRNLDSGDVPPSVRAAEIVLALAAGAAPAQIPDSRTARRRS